MAGDWIKVEVNTSRKTEVLRMSEMLGISTRECMGLLLDYWAWLDANARAEFVPNVSRNSLDSVLNCPGFSACIEVVGWAEWAADGWGLTVGNYDHHNGASAKTRAYEQRKKKIQRESLSRICPAETGTREEKRREEITTSLRSVVPASKKTALTEPTEEHHAVAIEAGVDCQAEFRLYRDWLAANGKKHADERAGFRNWLRRAGTFKARDAPKGNVHDKRSATAAAMTGTPRSNDEPHDITAEVVRVA